MSKNGVTLKISKEGKNFINNMKINRQYLTKKGFTISECLDLIATYFKKNNAAYQEMIQGDIDNKLIGGNINE